MEFLRNSTPRADEAPSVVTGSSLSDAYKKVRKNFGAEAVISGTRTRTRRKSSGWGTEKVVEVLVAAPGTAPGATSGPMPASDNLTAEIRYEVERLERMVEDTIHAGENQSGDRSNSDHNPLGDFLVGNGASAAAVDRLLTRFAGETGLERNDRPGAMSWLTGYLQAGTESLTQLKGNHAFIAEHAGDRLEMVLPLAGRLAESGRKVLVLAVLPDPERDLGRLRHFAEKADFDAAVVQTPDQFQDLAADLSKYDVVLVDLPPLTDPAMEENGPVHRWVAADMEFHRHLQIPLDRDFLDLGFLREAARGWNCDWLALTRLDVTRRPAKLLDLVDTIPLPVSVMAAGGLEVGLLEAATPEMLLDLTLNQEPAPRFTPGLPADGV